MVAYPKNLFDLCVVLIVGVDTHAINSFGMLSIKILMRFE